MVSAAVPGPEPSARKEITPPLSIKTKIITAHLQETRDFYVRIFGMKVVEEWGEADDAGAILALADGRSEALLEVYEGDDARDYSAVSLQFKVDSLDAFQAALPTSVEALGPKVRPWGSTYLYLKDPNGIDIIVYEGGL